MTTLNQRPPPHLVTRRPHRALSGLRGRRAGLLALLAVVGPGLLAGLSDDDPAGITTYSILGADYGYRLLWVLTLSTVALIVFHDLAARTGVVTGKGLMRLVHERYGGRLAQERWPRWWWPTSARSAPSSPASPPGCRSSRAPAAT